MQGTKKMPKFKKPHLLSGKELNTIRGKAIVGAATPQELMQVFGHIDILETKMEELDCDDFFGTEGFRHFLGYPDA
jgi:hypothetical protein